MNSTNDAGGLPPINPNEYSGGGGAMPPAIPAPVAPPAEESEEA